MHTWQMEYSNSYPCIRIRFTVKADTYEEAIIKGNRIISEVRMSACYKISGPGDKK